MRLWHKALIEYLPQQQLISQWRELCAIASCLAKDHTPNHILVNPILDYDPSHFISYTSLIYKELYERGFNITEKPKKKLEDDIRAWQLYLKDELPWELDDKIPVPYDQLYSGWHNGRYLQQCYYNLEEKYDRGGINDDEWSRVLRCHAIDSLYLPFPMNPPEREVKE